MKLILVFMNIIATIIILFPERIRQLAEESKGSPSISSGYKF